MFRWTLIIVHLLRMLRNVSRDVFNDWKNVNATAGLQLTVSIRKCAFGTSRAVTSINVQLTRVSLMSLANRNKTLWQAPSYKWREYGCGWRSKIPPLTSLCTKVSNNLNTIALSDAVFEIRWHLYWRPPSLRVDRKGSKIYYLKSLSQTQDIPELLLYMKHFFKYVEIEFGSHFEKCPSPSYTRFF